MLRSRVHLPLASKGYGRDGWGAKGTGDGVGECATRNHQRGLCLRRQSMTPAAIQTKTESLIQSPVPSSFEELRLLSYPFSPSHRLTKDRTKGWPCLHRSLATSAAEKTMAVSETERRRRVFEYAFAESRMPVLKHWHGLGIGLGP